MVISFCALFFMLNGCVEPFSPPEVNSDEGYLVVDGFLNMGADTSTVVLSRTQSASVKTSVTMEPGAKINVEEESGVTFSFTEKGNGSYFLPPVALNMSGKYRIRIKTKNGKEYLSDLVEVKNTPPIDTVAMVLDTRQDAAIMQVNTHDAQNKTRFYRWKFEETWEYRAPLYSALELVKGQIVSRKENINTCYRTIKSGNILLGSTIKLTQDVIKNLPLTTVQYSTGKLLIKYSLLVKQYGLTQDAFEYWTSLAKTTEGTGSLFDPLPSQVTGNIKCTTDNQELVFGYFSAAVEMKKRVFFTPGLGSFTQCQSQKLDIADALKTSALLLNFSGEMPDSVFVTSESCADCRAQGGVLKRPSFW